jgi:hypothetical protein
MTNDEKPKPERMLEAIMPRQRSRNQSLSAAGWPPETCPSGPCRSALVPGYQLSVVGCLVGSLYPFFLTRVPLQTIIQQLWPDNRMDKTGIHHVDSIVFLYYGFYPSQRRWGRREFPDIRDALFGPTDTNAKRRLSARITRLFNKLHARGLIAKIPRSRRWRVTQKGWRVLGPLVEAYA